MDIKNILAHCDHTLLKPESTWEQIRAICDEGMKYGCASVCIPAAYVKQANDYVGNSLKVCTVIGFPNGYSTTEVKVFETEDAVRNGADEIDMVINIGWVKDRRWDDLLEEIRSVKASCGGRILKIIVEACLLTEEEKIKMCQEGGRGPLCPAHRPRRAHQGRRRHLHPPGRPGLPGPGRRPPGHLPDREAGPGPAGRGVLSTSYKHKGRAAQRRAPF